MLPDKQRPGLSFFGNRPLQELLKLPEALEGWNYLGDLLDAVSYIRSFKIYLCCRNTLPPTSRLSPKRGYSKQLRCSFVVTTAALSATALWEQLLAYHPKYTSTDIGLHTTNSDIIPSALSIHLLKGCQPPAAGT